MAAVTQRIGSYLGGVSKQSDDKMLPGQVRECYNGFPDATYGLTKRPGFKHVVNLGTGTAYDGGKWFYIKRDDDEEYVGVIKGTAINIWNAVSGAVCTVTTPDGTGYLSGTKDNYKIITVQDTSIIINSSVTVSAQPAPTFNANRVATVQVEYVASDTNYEISIKIGGTTVTANYATPSSGATADLILNDLKTDIEAMTGSHANIAVTKLDSSLELTHSSFMEVEAKGGMDNKALTAVQDEVASIAELPFESKHGRTIKIVNTNSSSDTYWAEFKAHNTTYNTDGTVNVAGSGEGYWEETRDPSVSPGLDNSTLPHELINTSLNQFTFKKIAYENRLVGDDETNSHPSFIDEKITAGFFHNNRLGFLSKYNVIMSQSGDFYNFYFKSAQTTIDSDPIDISCSSIKPTALHAALPTAQGVVLFSENQQFVMFADAGVLTPSLATIRALSNYEMDRNIEPVDVGTNLNFITKTPGYSRVFSMVTRGQQENPQVLDLSRVVKEWISPDIDQLISSPQNSMVAMTGQSLKEVFIFRYYNDGKENLMEAWVSWLMPGTVQFIETHSDDMYAVTKQGNQFVLSKAALSQSPEQAIIVNNQGQKVNPCVDLYATASSVVYDSVNKVSKCYLPFNDASELTPIIVIKGNTSSGSFVESGFTVTPERGSDGTGPFFSVANKDLTSVASDVIVGFKYNFDVELPRTYFRPDPRQTDFTANLTIARMKFAVGLSGMMSFKLQQTGRLPYELEFTGEETVAITGNGTSSATNKLNIPTTTNGSGTGMTVDLTASGGVVTAIKINQSGSGYADNDVITISAADAGTGTAVTGTYTGLKSFTFNKRDLDYVDRSDVQVTVNGINETGFSFTNDTTIVFTSAPANNAKIKFFIKEWFTVQPVIEANTYLANDVPLDNENVFAIPIHQRTENFRLKMFNNSPFPVAVNAMMWEGNYTPRFYRRV